jgi:hypothetical protein
VTPALIGPDYFRETAAIVNAGGPPDLEKIKAVMNQARASSSSAAEVIPDDASGALWRSEFRFFVVLPNDYSIRCLPGSRRFHGR